MNTTLKKTLAIRLSLLEERVLEMKRLLHTPSYMGNFYSIIQDLSTKEREEMATLLEEVFQALSRLKRETSLSPHQERTSRLLVGTANTTFVSCLELEPKRMKGYGGDTTQYRRLWTERLEPLKDLIQSLAQKAERTRK